MNPEKEPCGFCGDADWTEAHFVAGRLVCKLCWSGSKPAASMPPTPHQRAQIAAWLRPRTSTSPMQRTLPGVELAQREGANRG
jgi:hypothetical protein